MRAVAMRPGIADSLHMVDLPTPRLEDVPQGQGVLVKLVRVGLDGTDREILDAEYGAAPPEYDFLVPGHESLGVVQQVGPRVSGLTVGDYVVALVRRPGISIYDAIGRSDLSTDTDYREHGINLFHGYLTEYYADAAEYIVPIPHSLREVGVLVEPLSICEKGVAQAYEVQRRLRVWRPRVAAVLGAGTIGLLTTMALRLRGLDVVTLGLEEPPYLNSDLVQALTPVHTGMKSMTSATPSEERNLVTRTLVPGQ